MGNRSQLAKVEHPLAEDVDRITVMRRRESY